MPCTDLIEKAFQTYNISFQSFHKKVLNGDFSYTFITFTLPFVCMLSYFITEGMNCYFNNGGDRRVKVSQMKTDDRLKHWTWQSEHWGD